MDIVSGVGIALWVVVAIPIIVLVVVIKRAGRSERRFAIDTVVFTALMGLLIVIVFWVGLSGTSAPSDSSDYSSGGGTTIASISGTGMPMDTDETTFNSNMSRTEVLHVDGSLTVTARIDPTGDYPAVEGYVMPANAPDDPATYRDYSYTQIDLISGQESDTFDDLQGDYFVVAGGQDCSWSLDVTY